MNAEDFWQDQKKAQALIRETNGLRSLIDQYHRLNESLAGLNERTLWKKSMPTR